MPSPTLSHLPARPRPVRRLSATAVGLVLVATLAGCGGDETSETPTSQAGGECTYTADAQGAARAVDLPPGDPDPDAPTAATIVTDRGDIAISLDPDEAPCTVNSFLSLVDQNYYDDTPCHRLTGGQGLSVLQCGDPTGSGSGGPGYAFDDELQDDDPRLQCTLDQVDPSSGQPACTFPAGTVAMANAGPGTNGSQFFLVYEDSVLGNAYTVFGRMSAAGLQVVRDVAQAGNGPDGVSPATSVRIEDVATAG